MFVASNKRKSTDLEGAATPKLGPKQNGAKTPKSGLKVQTPKAGLKMQTPKTNLKPGTPKSEKKNTPKNGARKALAVNGSPKVEKALDAEKPAVGAAANKNRKRSLSEGSVESKTQKLEQFAGTAALATEKKGQRNRSARRHQQFKDKKKTLSKDNKRQIREKILGGDIEALREIQSKLDALIAKPAGDRSKSARRKIRKLQSWLKIKTKKGDDSNTSLTTDAKVQKPGQKKNQPKNKKGQQAVKVESELADDASDDSDEEVSNEGDSEMQSAESDEDIEDDSDDIDEEDSDEEMTSEFIVDAKGKKPNQKPVNNKAQTQNKGKPVGRPGNNKFAGRQKKGPQKK